MWKYTVALVALIYSLLTEVAVCRGGLALCAGLVG